MLNPQYSVWDVCYLFSEVENIIIKMDFRILNIIYGQSQAQSIKELTEQWHLCHHIDTHLK